MTEPTDNVRDFLKYKDQRTRLQNLTELPDLSKLGVAELGSLVQLLSRMVLQQAELINGIMAELAVNAQNHSDMQQQFMYVSGQAFMSTQMLKDKNICTAEELHESWHKILQEKILVPQGLEEKPEELEEPIVD